MHAVLAVMFELLGTKGTDERRLLYRTSEHNNLHKLVDAYLCVLYTRIRRNIVLRLIRLYAVTRFVPLVAKVASAAYIIV